MGFGWGSWVKVGLAFQPDKTIKTEAQLNKRLQAIAVQTGTPFAAVQEAAAGVLSAKGTLTNAQGLESLKQSLRLGAGDPELARVVPHGVIWLQRMTGILPKSLLGFSRQAMLKSRLTDLSKFFPAFNPLATTERAAGGTIESAAELFSFLSLSGEDMTGESSRTAGISLVNRLRTFSPRKASKGRRGERLRATKGLIERYRAAKSTNERLRILQHNPQLAEQFLAASSFEQRFQAPIEGLGTGRKEEMALMRDARVGIEDPRGKLQAKRFDEFATRKRPYGALTEAMQKSTEATDEFLRGRSLASRRAFARHTVDESLNRVNLVAGPDFPERCLLGLQLEKRLAFNAESPEQSAVALLKRAQGYGAMDRELKALLQKQITILEQTEKKLSSYTRPGYVEPVQAKGLDRRATGRNN